MLCIQHGHPVHQLLVVRLHVIQDEAFMLLGNQVGEDYIKLLVQGFLIAKCCFECVIGKDDFTEVVLKIGLDFNGERWSYIL